jgi:hypothetical protein
MSIHVDIIAELQRRAVDQAVTNSNENSTTSTPPSVSTSKPPKSRQQPRRSNAKSATSVPNSNSMSTKIHSARRREPSAMWRGPRVTPTALSPSWARRPSKRSAAGSPSAPPLPSTDSFRSPSRPPRRRKRCGYCQRAPPRLGRASARWRSRRTGSPTPSKTWATRRNGLKTCNYFRPQPSRRRCRSRLSSTARSDS